MEQELVRYIIVGCSLVCAWTIFSTFLVVILCINSGRLIRNEEKYGRRNNNF